MDEFLEFWEVFEAKFEGKLEGKLEAKLEAKLWTSFLEFLRARPFGARWAGPPLPCVQRKY